MSKKVLLLNDSYEVISFLSFKRALKLVFKNKAEIIAEWNDLIVWSNGSMNLPSILRLKNHVKRNYFNMNFSRRALIKRDRLTCQYCQKKLTPPQITIDHIIPKVSGGLTSYTNCVVSCQACNSKKGRLPLEQSGLSLLRKPLNPSLNIANYLLEPQDHWHESWNDYLNNS